MRSPLSLGGSQEASADSLERRSASKLRKRGEAVLDAKYDGKKGSRAALYGDGEDDDEEEESPAEEDDELDGLGGEEDDEGEDDDDEMGDFEDLEGASEGASEEEAASGEDEDEEEEDEEDDDAPMPPPSSTSRPSQPRSERAMVSQLQRAASADVEKGRDVKKQLAFCDSLLEARIKLQKAVGAVNSLPPPPSAESYFAEARSEVDEARREIEGLGEELFALREVRPLGLVPSSLARVSRRLTPPVHAPHSRAEPPRDQREDRAPGRLWRVAQAQADVLGCGGLGGVPRRDALGPCRPRGYVRPSPPPYPLCLPATKLTHSAPPARDDSHRFDPFLRTTVSKWSDKVLAASGLALSKDKKFKAVNQNALAQVDHALSGAGERERLVRRTRIRRGEGFPLGRAKANEGDGEAEAAPLEGDKVKAGKEVDDECFDDSDFYQQLLRDVVESRMLDLGTSPSLPPSLLSLPCPRVARPPPSTPPLTSPLCICRRRDPDAPPARDGPRARQEGQEAGRHARVKGPQDQVPRAREGAELYDPDRGRCVLPLCPPLFLPLRSRGRRLTARVLPPSTGDWHEEQVDELFASLLGRSFPQAQQHQDAPAPLDPALDDVAPARAGEIDVGSLRLFG